MKFLITGGTGQLGYDLKRELLLRGYDAKNIFVPSREEMDITKEEVVKKVMLQLKPDIVFHCAAYTAVDQAEEDREACYAINVMGTKYLTKYASEIRSRIIYISTDYVFDGIKEGIYEVSDAVCPVNYYGETKYLGEEEVKKYFNHLIVRISWVFGIHGKNFVKTMLKLSLSKNEISVITDQVGSPTYTKDLSKLLVDMALSEKTGIYHATNEGYCSWYEFCQYIFEVNGIKMKVNPILTCDYPTKAKRPLNSKLDKEKLVVDGFYKLPDWKDAVLRYCEELRKEGEIK